MTNADEPLRKLRSEHQARAILQALASDVCNGSITDYLLCDYLRTIALGGSLAQVRTAVGRLEEIGLVETRNVDEYLIATLTRDGEEVATGITQVDGIAKPRRD
nr:hypothetical protein [uncultured Sphaerochaeta sp.]